MSSQKSLLLEPKFQDDEDRGSHFEFYFLLDVCGVLIASFSPMRSITVTAKIQ